MDPTCQPVAGTVYLALANEPTAGHDTYSTAFVRSTADANGNFEVHVDPGSPNMVAALNAAQSSNDGWVNFDLGAFGPTGRLGFVSFSRFSKNKGWYEGTRSEPANPRSIALVTRATSASSGPGSGPVDGCSWQHFLVGETDGLMKVGEIHTGADQSAVFTYGVTADSQIGVATSIDGNHWAIDSSVHVGNTLDTSGTWPRDSEIGQVLKSQFHYRKTGMIIWCIGYSGNWYWIKPSGWNGGNYRGRNIHSLDHQCLTTYEQWKMPADPGSVWRKFTGTAKQWHAAVSVFGVTVDAQSGFSNRVGTVWTFGHNYQHYWLCGSDGPFTTASRIFAGA